MNVLKDIGYGLELLHNKELVHRDVKPNNFFYIGDIHDEKNPVKGKLADFGYLAKTGDNSGSGSLLYLPPEAIIVTRDDIIYNDKCKAGKPIDRYSFGVSILETILPRTDPIKKFIQGEFDVPFFGEKTRQSDFKKKCIGFFSSGIQRDIKSLYGQKKE